MKTAIKSTIAVAATTAAIAGVAALPSLVSAWGDNGSYTFECGTAAQPKTCKGRPSYTVEQINNDAVLGPTKAHDGDNYKQAAGYPGKIIFNTISNSTIGDEKNFVGARECYVDGTRCLDATTKANPTPTTQWNGNDIEVKDGATYTIRIYAHNNNPNGYDAVAENTRVSFSIPNASTKNGDNNLLKVSGFIKANTNTVPTSQGQPTEYWDYVNFYNNAGVPFHLKYIEGSARLNNNKTQDMAAAGGYSDNAGWQLSDDIVKAASVDGVLIGSDALDGRVPGCYSYANYVTIQVKALFDYDYTVDKKVRLADSEDRTWKESVDAKVGDRVEFRIVYTNTSDKTQDNVAIKDILPKNLKYIPTSTILKNTTYPNGAYILNDSLVVNGIRIGQYLPNGGNALVYFTAEVVDENLACGDNTLINWAQAGVGQKTIQDNASVKVNKYCENTPPTPPAPTPENPETPETPKELPNTGPEAIVGGITAAGSIATAAGYYIASRRQLR